MNNRRLEPRPTGGGNRYPTTEDNHWSAEQLQGFDPAQVHDPCSRNLALVAVNKHIAFGFGAHYCLGTHLARLETRAFYDELIPRLNHAELAGEPAFMQTIFVGGPKRVPVRYELR